MLHWCCSPAGHKQHSAPVERWGEETLDYLHRLLKARKPISSCMSLMGAHPNPMDTYLLSCVTLCGVLLAELMEASFSQFAFATSDSQCDYLRLSAGWCACAAHSASADAIEGSASPADLRVLHNEHDELSMHTVRT